MRDKLDILIDFLRAEGKRIGVCKECDTFALVDRENPGTCECGRAWSFEKWDEAP